MVSEQQHIIFTEKNLNELELHEVAMLAGLPQSPNGYNPFKNPERAEKRRNIVLRLNVSTWENNKRRNGRRAEQFDVASTLLPEENRLANDNTKYPAFIDLVINELEDAGC